jgi:hypothetical protein
MKETCPKCGAEWNGKIDPVEVHFKCGSYNTPMVEIFHQSDRCRITELEKENEKLNVLDRFPTFTFRKYTEKGGHLDYFLDVVHGGTAYRFDCTDINEALKCASTLLDLKGGKTE